ncbi:MAG: glycerophosphodiester phosphodiesterase family protein, partial [Nitrososphaeraceae archaeon]|nr:glycerophosphodiester phosphodiesterase family protein [Nitrososphaeraceae archaeon]
MNFDFYPNENELNLILMRFKPRKRLYILISLLILILAIVIYWPVNALKKLDTPENLIFAHRGYLENATENTKLAFSLADSLGFKAIETDIQQTKDGHLIILHDDNTQRLFGDNRQVKDLDLDYFIQNNIKNTDQKVLTLRQFFESYGHQFKLYLDVKTRNVGVADSLISLIQEFELSDEVIIADADVFFLANIKKRAPQLITALEGFTSEKAWFLKLLPSRYIPDYYAGFLKNMNKETAEELKDNELIDRYIAYEVNSENLH